MRIEYICHSCLYIDTGDTRIMIDPWFNGPAYRGQWHVFPPPVDTRMVGLADHLLYSHGHEDHLHGPTLDLYNRDTHIFYPFQWRDGIRSYFSEQGFRNLTEAASFTRYRLSATTSVTYIGFGLESVMIIEVNGTVIVNLNDALNSHHQNVVDMFLKEIRKRWPKIHYLFSGWSGAGYFPNMVHYPGKNDEETGRIREQYFCNHFCKIVKQLQPEAAIPFAPGFVLLKDELRWINRVKFPREMLSSYYHDHFEPGSGIRFLVMEPGDYINDHAFHPVSPWHERFREHTLDELIEQTYAVEIGEAEKYRPAHPEVIKQLPEKLRNHLNRNSSLYDKEVLENIRFSLKLNDSTEDQYFNIDFRQDQFDVTITEHIPPDRNLLVRTSADLLIYAMDNEWGGDALTIGYGLDVDVFNEPALEKNLDIVCVRMLTSYPTASKHLKNHPLRAARYFIRHPMMTKLMIKQKLMFRNTINKFPYNERDHWISYSKCELCKVCDMPLLSFGFGEKMAV